MSGNRRKGGKGRRVPAQRPARGKSPRVLEDASGPSLESQLWEELRQGARNVAGVRYQLAVAAHILVECRSGSLPFVDLVPEGLEDIDCLDGDGRRWLIQVKELGAGAGRFTAASVADVVSHAAAAAGDHDRIVAVTDAQLGRQLVETGWTTPISDAAGFDVEAVTSALERLGHSAVDAAGLVARSHLVRLEWNSTPRTNTVIASTFDIPDAVAAVVTCHLVEDLARVSSDQRHTTADRPGRRAPGDLDALVQRVLTVVDMSGLDAAVLSGVCQMADYSATPAATRKDFLLGVDAVPSHIGAGFDVIRPVQSRAVQEALEAARYCLVAGPSGSGKSGQMWRSARDVAPGSRVLRVLRLESDDDVQGLIRHVRLLGPSEHSPVIVCGDDLGRPRTARWPVAATRLLEEPNVLLIGGVRQEDFGPELLRHGGELVSMVLDDASATAIADQIELAGIECALEVAEAVRLADGQLMEFVALLTSGRRLEAVLADQADSLLMAEDPAGADVARLVCAAHVLGVSVPADEVADVIPSPGLVRALRRLQDEHLITVEQGNLWRGLHQRRSDALTRLLHRSPPPTLPTTMSTVLARVPPGALGWALRRLVELMPEVHPRPGVTERSADSVTTAASLATLLEGLERADHSVTAEVWDPILEQHRKIGVEPSNWALLVLGNKLGGVRFGEDDEGLLGRMGRAIERCANDLPDRHTTYCDEAATFVAADRMTDLMVAAPLEDAVRLAEAAALYIELPTACLKRIAEAFPWPTGIVEPSARRLSSRLIAACGVAAQNPDDLHTCFGAVDVRLEQAAGSARNVVSLEWTDLKPDEATLELLADPSSSDSAPHLPWDLAGGPAFNEATPNDNAVQLAIFVGECCPELKVVEVRTVTADGKPLRIGDHEPGYKRLGRSARPPRELVRVNVGIQAALTRRYAANSWTELVRQRAAITEELLDLVKEAPRRCAAPDNPKKRARWSLELEELTLRIGALPMPPTIAELDMGDAAATWDAQRDREPLTKAVSTAADALRNLVPAGGAQVAHVVVADQMLKAVQSLNGALVDPGLLTTTSERRAVQLLADELDVLRDVLVAVGWDSSLATQIRGNPTDLRANLEALVAQGTRQQLDREARDLGAVFHPISAIRIRPIPDEQPFLTAIGRHQWLVTVPPDEWDQVATLSAAHPPKATDVPVSIVCELDGVLLPIGGRLSQLFPSGLLPLEPNSIASLATAVGTLMVEGETLGLVTTAVQALERASLYAARTALRPSAWPAPDDGPDPDMAMAVAAIAHLGGPTAEVAEPLEVLLDRVRSEVGGYSERTPLSAELSGSGNLDLLNLDEEHALREVSRAWTLALEAEIQQAI